jgi:hypothetical protein
MRRHTESDSTGDQEIILGPRAGHRIFQERGLVHVLVDGVAELEEQRVLHVAREFLWSSLLAG